jgi:hypothetical protein
MFRALTREDGPIEWAQFAFFAVGGFGAALVSHRLAKQGLARWAVLYGLAAFGLLVVAGEEISWGQRVLGFDTPHELAEINSQGESTIHNVGAAQELFKAGEFAVALFGAVTPLVMRARRRPGPPSIQRFAALTVPPLALVPAFAVMAGYRIARYAVVPKTWATVEATETAELCLALGIATFVFLVAHRLRHEIPDEYGSWTSAAGASA